MTAAFLGASAEIIEDGFENSAAYLRGWLEVLRVKENRTWLVRAASEAQRAADYVLGAARSLNQTKPDFGLSVPARRFAPRSSRRWGNLGNPRARLPCVKHPTTSPAEMTAGMDEEAAVLSWSQRLARSIECVGPAEERGVFAGGRNSGARVPVPAIQVTVRARCRCHGLFAAHGSRPASANVQAPGQ